MMWLELVHDQGSLAWIVVAAYAVGALLALAAVPRSAGRERGFWGLTAVALILLGLNKQLDLQTDLTLAAKYLAQSEGWYDWRREAQGIFLLVIALGAAAAAFFLLRWLRGSSASARVAAAGLVTLFAFIVIRAASFHHVDYWVTVNVGGLRSGWWLELLGIGIIAGAALASVWRNPRKSSV
jgi:hypothetical protein